MTQARSEDTVLPERILLLAVEDNMGLETHRLLKEAVEEVTAETGEGVTVKGEYFAEDYRQSEALLMLFPAEPINGLTGFFVLSLMPAEPGAFSLKQPTIELRDGKFVWTAEMRNDVPVTRRWSYTRRPHLRHVYLPLFDDPYESLEATIFHQAPLQEPASANVSSGSGAWQKVQIPLAAALINQSVGIDQCARLLEELDDSFNVGDDEFLYWHKEKATPESIDRIATELEASGLLEDGQTFNVTLAARGQESTRNKRVRPLVYYPITLFDEDGAPIPATLACSISS